MGERKSMVGAPKLEMTEIYAHLARDYMHDVLKGFNL
jgi:hypothetical protein